MPRHTHPTRVQQAKRRPAPQPSNPPRQRTALRPTTPTVSAPEPQGHATPEQLAGLADLWAKADLPRRKPARSASTNGWSLA